MLQSSPSVQAAGNWVPWPAGSGSKPEISISKSALALAEALASSISYDKPNGFEDQGDSCWDFKPKISVAAESSETVGQPKESKDQGSPKKQESNSGSQKIEFRSQFWFAEDPIACQGCFTDPVQTPLLVVDAVAEQQVVEAGKNREDSPSTFSLMQGDHFGGLVLEALEADVSAAVLCRATTFPALSRLQVMLLVISGGCVSLSALFAWQSSRERAEMVDNAQRWPFAERQSSRERAEMFLFCILRATLAFRSGWAVAGGPMCTDFCRKMSVALGSK